MAKRQLDEADTYLTGYVANVSPLKKSRSDSLYFTADVQTSGQSVQHCVAFSPATHDSFVKMATSHSPVKLSKVQQRPGTRETPDVFFNRNSQIEVAKKLQFEYKDRLFSTQDVSETRLISEIHGLVPNSKVNLTAKVVTLYPPTDVSVSFKSTTSKKQDVFLADTTSNIRLTLWNEHTNTLKQNAWYNFQEVLTKVFQNKVNLSTTASSSIEAIDQISESVCLENIPSDIAGVFQIKGARSSVIYKCAECAKMVKLQFGLKTSDCPACFMRQRSNDFKPHFKVEMSLSEIKTGDRVNVTSEHGPMMTFLSDNNKGEMRHADDLSDFLLDFTHNVHVTYASRSKFVRQIRSVDISPPTTHPDTMPSASSAISSPASIADISPTSTHPVTMPSASSTVSSPASIAPHISPLSTPPATMPSASSPMTSPSSMAGHSPLPSAPLTMLSASSPVDNPSANDPPTSEDLAMCDQ